MVRRVPLSLRHEAPTSAVAERLSQRPWSAALLESKTFTPIASPEREPKPHTEDTLMAETFATPRTIHTWQAFYRPGDAANEADVIETNAVPAPGVAALWGELRIVVGAGAGLSGHIELAHGGFTAFVLDVVMTMLAEVHRDQGKSGFTARLEVDFVKPVPTPGWLLATAVLEPAEEGARKAWVKGTVEDGEGTVLAKGRALVVEVVLGDAKL